MLRGTGVLSLSEMDFPTRWSAWDFLRIAGWGCVFVAAALLSPCVGDGGGASREPGSDTVRALSFESGTFTGAVVLSAIGIAILAVGWLARRGD